MLKLWLKTFGREFFAQHAGLFLFVFYIIFGAVPPDHLKNYLIALCMTINSSPIAMGILILINLVFSIKCLFFVQKQLNDPTYHFVKISSAAIKSKQLQNWLLLYLFIHSPLIVINLMLMVSGLYGHFYVSAAILAGYMIIISGSLAYFTFRSVNYAFKPAIRLLNFPKISLKKPYWTWPLYAMLKEQTLSLIVCKILSFILFKAIIWMFTTNGNDVRIYLLGLMAAAISHCILISTALKFEKSYMNFVNSLPVNNWHKLFFTWVTILILMAPELFFYSSLNGFSILNTLKGIVLCSGILLYLRMSLYFVKEDMEKYLRHIFILLILSIMAIIANLYLPFSLLLTASGVIYHHYLYQKNNFNTDQ
ncbi:hypothetical protein [Pedobacter cryoconitis]|uniref:hypothetical protein n=1 Tax=Pedobacter cryoconitis TaxID=188932 RepID=UPI00161FC9B4|nr:hypothetical protein [Pedobacter cryoconitis]MBB5648991.1 hypothetical protein [Pedobacter cryoconitis]